MDSMSSSLIEQIYHVMTVPLQFSCEEDMLSSLAKLAVWEGGFQTHKQTIITQRVNIRMLRSTGSCEASEEKQLTCWKDWGMPSCEGESHRMARNQPSERKWCFRVLILLAHQDEGQCHRDTEYTGTVRVGAGKYKTSEMDL